MSDYTIKEVMQIFNCSHQTVYDMIADGQLESYKVRNARRIRHESVQRVRNGELTA